MPNQPWQNSWWSTHKIHGIKQIITLRGGICPELSTADHFQSLPHWFRLLTRWRREAVMLLTKSRNTHARHQIRLQKAKELSLWPQCDIRKIKKRRNPKSEVRRIQVRHRVTDCISQVSTNNSKVTDRRPQDETSLKIPVHKHRETDCSQR